MTMYRRIPWMVWLFYIALIIGPIAASVVGAFLVEDRDPAKMLGLIIWPMPIVTYALVLIFGRWGVKRNYIAYGMHVWTARQKGFSRPTWVAFEQAVELLVHTLPTMVRDSRINMRTLARLLMNVKVEFRATPLGWFSRFGWAVKDKLGAQHGKNIIVVWNGRFSSTAFYHELGHLILVELLHADADREHLDRVWWFHFRKLGDLAKNKPWNEGL